jgi:predicted nuclease with RNAse H fold
MLTDQVRVAGIDWAAKPKDRALVCLSHGDRFQIEGVESPLSDERVKGICTSLDYRVIAVDTPFGWPVRFSEFVASWSPTEECQVPVPKDEDFRLRLTDRIVHQDTGKSPLSVSSDKIGRTAHEWVKVLQEGNLQSRVKAGLDRSQQGEPAIIEVYPAAARAVLAAHGQGWPPSLAYLFEEFSNKVGDDKRSHKTDALIAAITALIYLGKVRGWSVEWPTGDREEAARREGWIFFPTRSSD